MNNKCECSGMEFLYNRWVFTGQCSHTRAEAVMREREWRNAAFNERAD